jgi:carbonic anhydrase
LPGPRVTIRDYLSVTASGYTSFHTASKNTQKVDFNEGKLDLVRADGIQTAFVPIGFLHFHTPSEHTFYGEYFDLELHIVHKYKETGKLGAVLGIMF